MIPIYFFAISGLAIPILIIAKKLELKRKKPFFVLTIISKSNIHIRWFYYRTVHYYSEGKEKIIFFFKRRVPLHSKKSSNKVFSFLAEKKNLYLNHMRGSRFLKKSDGISEFFKNMSDIEKGNGEIHDTYENGAQEEKEVR